jgi:hypothetical protein
MHQDAAPDFKLNVDGALKQTTVIHQINRADSTISRQTAAMSSRLVPNFKPAQRTEQDELT